MQKITPFLWFDGKAEEAMNFYVSIFIARVVQSLLLHEHAAPAYGITLTDERRSECHIRSVERMLDHLLIQDARAHR